MKRRVLGRYAGRNSDLGRGVAIGTDAAVGAAAGFALTAEPATPR